MKLTKHAWSEGTIGEALMLGVEIASYERAAESYSRLSGVALSKSSLQRLVAEYGGGLVKEQAAEAKAVVAVPKKDEAVVWRQEPLPDSPVMSVSADGVMINLRHEGWKEVKTVSVSAVTQTVAEAGGEAQLVLQHHSHQAGIWDAQTFAQHYWAETLRRGVNRAKHIACVNDGAPWIWAIVFICFARCVEILYFAEVPKDTLLWMEHPTTFLPEYGGKGRRPTQLRVAAQTPAPQTVAQIAAHLPASAWSLHALKEGSQGFLLAHMAFCRIVAVRKGLPGPALWLVLRRSTSDPTEIHYFLSNAPAHIHTDQLVSVAALRWPIETIFEQAKQLLSLNHYETRTWFGWHHHMTFVILAFGFLARIQRNLAPDAPALTLPQVVDLLKAVLPKPDFDPQQLIALLRYKQARIASAKKGHYLSQKKNVIDKLLVTQ